ncbi:MAG: Ig-like domain-containing protein [Euryarchaeota archaeon]|nr:Ig-like domain-containing protein [Euryarchaeota archaeon]
MRIRYIILAVLLVIVIILPVFYFSGYLDNVVNLHQKPTISITYPQNDETVSKLVMISGIASNLKNDASVLSVEVQINNGEWALADGTIKWSLSWDAYTASDGSYTISARAYDGIEYSDIKSITVQVNNPESNDADSGAHKWAIFIAAANFPEDNKSKLGNGGLSLAEEMAAYFIDTYNYPASNTFILFDDGWIRSDNGYGERIQTLQERTHTYDITYGAAKKKTVLDILNYVISESNKYKDSEVFLWVFNHGYGNENKTFTGGKILSRSIIFLWDDTMTDKELGQVLKPLKSTKTCVIVDACYSGGFADKTIFERPTSLLLHSGIPKVGRVVIAGASKYRKGYASTTEGPLFTLLWFEGLKDGKADGYKPGLLGRGRPMYLKFFKDGKVSVEEAFYYARYVLRTDSTLKDYKSMQPQINDDYPHRGIILLNRKEMILG